MLQSAFEMEKVMVLINRLSAFIAAVLIVVAGASACLVMANAAHAQDKPALSAEWLALLVTRGDRRCATR